MNKPLTTDEKWFPVDNIIRQVNSRRKRGDRNPHRSNLDYYVDYTFGTERNNKSWN